MIKAKKYTSESVRDYLHVEMRQSKTGELFYCVDYFDNDHNPRYVTFQYMSSVLDFIQSNIKLTQQ